MSINPIRNDDLQAVLRRRESICQAAEQTPEADERDMLVTRLEAYENPHDDFGPADPIDVIKLRMAQQGLTARDLEPYIGPFIGPFIGPYIGPSGWKLWCKRSAIHRRRVRPVNLPQRYPPWPHRRWLGF